MTLTPDPRWVLTEALMDAGPDLMGWATGGNLHSGDADTILAALAARGYTVALAAQPAPLLDVELARRCVVQVSIYLANGDLVAAHEELAVALAALKEPKS